MRKRSLPRHLCRCAELVEEDVALHVGVYDACDEEPVKCPAVAMATRKDVAIERGAANDERAAKRRNRARITSVPRLAPLQ